MMPLSACCCCCSLAKYLDFFLEPEGEIRSSSSSISTGWDVRLQVEIFLLPPLAAKGTLDLALMESFFSLFFSLSALVLRESFVVALSFFLSCGFPPSSSSESLDRVRREAGKED